MQATLVSFRKKKKNINKRTYGIQIKDENHQYCKKKGILKCSGRTKHRRE